MLKDGSNTVNGSWVAIYLVFKTDKFLLHTKCKKTELSVAYLWILVMHIGRSFYEKREVLDACWSAVSSMGNKGPCHQLVTRFFDGNQHLRYEP